MLSSVTNKVNLLIGDNNNVITTTLDRRCAWQWVDEDFPTNEKYADGKERIIISKIITNQKKGQF